MMEIAVSLAMPKVIEFFVKGQNEIGNTAISEKITATVNFDCAADLIAINPVAPKGWTLDSSYPVMKVSLQESSVSSYSLSIKELFTNQYPQYCSLSSFAILKVIEKSTKK